MEINFLSGVLEIANFFIALFVLVFAVQFFRKSHSHHHRRPWEYLAIASLLFAIFELLGVLEVLNIFFVPSLRELILSLFTAIILLSFAHQHHLIHHHDDGIHIHKKEKHKKNP